MSKTSKRPKPPPRRCCQSAEHADTGHYSKGHHNHGQVNTALHHATGSWFRADASTTDAVLVRMRKAGVE